MNAIGRLVVIMPFCLVLAACGSQEDKVQERVWQGQTQAIEKAKKVEDMVMDAAAQQQQRVDEEIGKMQQR